MRRHHRQPGAHRECERRRHQRFAALRSGALQLQVVAAGEQGGPGGSELVGGRGVAGGERVPYVAAGKARQRDQAFGAIAEPVHRQLGARAVLVLQPGAGNELAQPQVALVRSAQQQRAERLVAVGCVLDPAIDAHQGLHAGFAGRGVELHHAEDVAGIGERERRHAVRLRLRHRFVDADNPVRHRVLAMHPQVYEAWCVHVKSLPSRMA
jgi:hypothetical protein